VDVFQASILIKLRPYADPNLDTEGFEREFIGLGKKEFFTNIDPFRDRE
jgi:hypothetical protein